MVRIFNFRLLAHVFAAGDDGPPIGQMLSTELWCAALAIYRPWLVHYN
jgi:hypothetical protein